MNNYNHYHISVANLFKMRDLEKKMLDRGGDGYKQI